MKIINDFKDLMKKNRLGEKTGIYSVCSAHQLVIEAAMEQAKADNSILLIESTSNQVDQFGGYTGMKPRDFVAYVRGIARQSDFPENRILFGGDHLGPNAWQSLNAEEAMKNSRVLIASYVAAGYQKIHLDTSMFCADDSGNRHEPLADSIVAERSADLCSIAEKTWKENFEGSSQLVYIIGTEVPIPGGIQDPDESVVPTSATDAQTTIEVTRKAFLKNGLKEAWNRVVGVVVQPGVEYGDDKIYPYSSKQAVELSNTIDNYQNMVFEAHSTDYQSESALSNLVKDHFCILKVGPWLTFAYREALFALESIEGELIDSGSAFTPSGLRKVLEEVMVENPGYWKKYYSGNEQDLWIKRKFSLSDRSRYYWPEERLQKAVSSLIENLSGSPVPATLISQYLPGSFDAVLDGSLEPTPENLLKQHIRIVLGKYSRACNSSLSQ